MDEKRLGRRSADGMEPATEAINAAINNVTTDGTIVLTEREPQAASHALFLADVRCEADQLRSELLGTVSHELRSPLASIKGYAAMLLRHEQRLPSAERRDFLEAISQASDRLEAVIDRMLEMSQLEAGAVRIERFSLDIERLVDDAVLEARQVTQRRAPGQYTFVVARQPGATTKEGGERETSPLLVRGDARRLRHVLDQVLENAGKYSPNGGTIAVTIRVCSLEQPHELGTQASRQGRRAPVVELVEIEVRDGGIGIPAEHLDRVFDRFHRIDNRLAREADGLGLGLTIARRIVELHGGSIWAESTLGRGSSFRIRLPLDSAVEGELPSEP